MVLAAWELLARVIAPASGAMPPLEKIAAAWIELWRTGGLAGDIRTTLGRVALGGGLGLAVALPLGSLIGLNRSVRLMFTGPVEYLRTLPAYATVYVFVALSSFDGGLLWLVGWGTGGVALAHCCYAMAHVPRQRVLFYRLIGAPTAFLWRQIWWRELLRVWVDSTRVAYPVALALAVVGELLIYGAAGHGLGGRLQGGLDAVQYPAAYAIIGTLGIFGVAGSVVLGALGIALRRRVRGV